MSPPHAVVAKKTPKEIAPAMSPPLAVVAKETPKEIAPAPVPEVPPPKPAPVEEPEEIGRSLTRERSEGYVTSLGSLACHGLLCDITWEPCLSRIVT